METLTSPQSSSSAKLAPGFRFHPTDEELVSYYLKRKILGKGFRLDAIADVDVYKAEPWELPEKSKLKSRDLEWYFFSVLDKKYGNGARTNRATEKGYWKTTGKDRTVFHKSHISGMKKTLVYHHGRAPRGQRTNWVMHEYRLIDENLAKAGIFQDAFVLCRIFQKSGSGPKNGERYGAPLIEEEWEEDELVLAPSKEVVEETVVTDDNDIYLDSSDLEQIFNAKIPVEDVLHPPRFNYGDNSCQVQETLVEESYHALADDPFDDLDHQHSPVLQMQNQMDVKPANQEFIDESSNSMNDLDFLLDVPFFDAIADGPFDDLAFLESDDLLNPIKEDPSGVGMLDEYLNFFNAQQDINSQYIAFDSSNMVGSENLAADQAFLSPELVYGGAKQDIMGNQQLLQGYNDDEAFVSKQKPENVESGGQYSFMEKASHMLGDISAPPALASEFPTKESALHLASVTSPPALAGMIQIQKPGSNGTETSWVHGKNVDFSFVLSFVLSHDNADDSLIVEQSLGDVLTKARSAMSRGVIYLMFFWILILAVTYKIGSCFCSGNVSS